MMSVLQDPASLILAVVNGGCRPGWHIVGAIAKADCFGNKDAYTDAVNFVMNRNHGVERL